MAWRSTKEGSGAARHEGRRRRLVARRWRRGGLPEKRTSAWGGDSGPDGEGQVGHRRRGAAARRTGGGDDGGGATGPAGARGLAW